MLLKWGGLRLSINSAVPFLTLPLTHHTVNFVRPLRRMQHVGKQSKVIHTGPELESCRYVPLLPLQRNEDGVAWAQARSRDHLMPLVNHRSLLFRGPVGDVKGVDILCLI